MQSEFFAINETGTIRRIYALAGLDQTSGIIATYCDGTGQDIIESAQDMANLVNEGSKHASVFYSGFQPDIDAKIRERFNQRAVDLYRVPDGSDPDEYIRARLQKLSQYQQGIPAHFETVSAFLRGPQNIA